MAQAHDVEAQLGFGQVESVEPQRRQNVPIPDAAGVEPLGLGRLCLFRQRAQAHAHAAMVGGDEIGDPIGIELRVVRVAVGQPRADAIAASADLLAAAAALIAG